MRQNLNNLQAAFKLPYCYHSKCKQFIITPLKLIWKTIFVLQFIINKNDQ